MADSGITPIPPRLRAVSQDRWLYTDRFLYAHAFHIAISFGGRVDEDRLQRALRLAMDAEPVFGCRYVPGRTPYWERRSDLDSLRLCEIAPTADVAAELERFLEKPNDPTCDPPIRARIVRGANDAVLFQINHVAADGAGGRDLVARIAALYRETGDRPVVVAPNLGERGTIQLFRELGAWNCLRLFRTPLRRADRHWRFPTADVTDQGALRVAMRRLPPAGLEALKAYGKSWGATLNDIFVAACFRALWCFLDSPYGIPQNIAVPVDIRRYLGPGKTEAIGNFTAPVFPRLPRVRDEAFEGTLQRVREVALARHSRRESALFLMLFLSLLHHLAMPGAERASKKRYRKHAANGYTDVVFSNTGVLAAEQLDFGVPVTDAYIVSQAAYAPGLLMTVGSFQRTLSFSITYPSRALRCADVERFLDTFVEELAEAAGFAAKAVSISGPGDY
jgi:NRPS condensation-like uncharacterized protein